MDDRTRFQVIRVETSREEELDTDPMSLTVGPLGFSMAGLTASSVISFLPHNIKTFFIVTVRDNKTGGENVGIGSTFDEARDKAIRVLSA